MTIKPFDQFNKRLFQELLSPFGQVIPNLAVSGEERMIDVFFAPHPGVVPDPGELGNLAQMVNQSALLEPFRSGLSDDDVQTCLIKLFMVHADLKREHPTIPVTTPPKLWILAAEVSDRILTDFGGQIHPILGEGFYQLVPGLHTSIVAIPELPTTPDTLWLRLLGKGRTQEDAISELLLLPEADPKRSNALSLLVSWRINIEVMEQVQQEERRILMALSQAYLEWEKETKRKGREQGLQQGLEQGLEQERRAAITNLMRLRYGAIAPELEALIPQLVALPSEEYTRLLLERSQPELIQYFAESNC
jgi:hypothetical protein